MAAAWVVAILATAGSLYFSEVAGFVPCTLCWYQRIAMYPLVVILGLAASRRDDRVAGRGRGPRAASVRSSPRTTSRSSGSPRSTRALCDRDRPCTSSGSASFGFISLPTLALIAFLLIIALLPSAIRMPEPWSRPMTTLERSRRVPSRRRAERRPPRRGRASSVPTLAAAGARSAARCSSRPRSPRRPAGTGGSAGGGSSTLPPSASAAAAARCAERDDPGHHRDVAAGVRRARRTTPAVGMTDPDGRGRRLRGRAGRHRARRPADGASCSSPTGARTARRRCRSSRPGSMPAGVPPSVDLDLGRDRRSTRPRRTTRPTNGSRARAGRAPVIVDPTGSVASAYGLPAFPFWVFIGPTGPCRGTADRRADAGRCSRPPSGHGRDRRG